MKSPILLYSSGLPQFCSQEHRSPGLHVSTVIYDLFWKSDQKAEQKSNNHVSVPESSDLIQSQFPSGSEDLMTLGRLMEWALKENFKKEWEFREHHAKNAYDKHEDQIFLDPGEIFIDGLHGTPDLYWIKLPGLNHRAVEEIKYTSRSSKGPKVEISKQAPSDHPIHGEKFRINWLQCATYCYMMSELYGDLCNFGILSLTHYRGDYTAPRADHNRWIRKFSEAELTNLWKSIKSHADKHFCYECGMRKEICQCQIG